MLFSFDFFFFRSHFDFIGAVILSITFKDSEKPSLSQTQLGPYHAHAQGCIQAFVPPVIQVWTKNAVFKFIRRGVDGPSQKKRSFFSFQ